MAFPKTKEDLKDSIELVLGGILEQANSEKEKDKIISYTRMAFGTWMIPYGWKKGLDNG